MFNAPVFGEPFSARDLDRHCAVRVVVIVYTAMKTG
jgi:hypothetical protein